VLPTTFVIDREGKIRRRVVGGTPEKIEALVSDVKGFLATAEADEGPGPAR